MLGSAAKYEFGLEYVRFMPLNADLTLPLPTATDPAGKGALIGDAETFDFSEISASDDAIPIYSKIDNGSVETNYVDLSGVDDISAATGTELLNALTAATITGATFSLEAVTSRIKCVFATGSYWQLYGECAEVAGFGQGYGAKFVKADTFKSFSDEPLVKAEETITTTDANGIDTEVITDGYRKGVTIGSVDAATDIDMLRLLEGGTLNTDGDYETPTSEDVKKYFFVEIFLSQYEEGTNKEADIASYAEKRYRTCKASIGNKSHERAFSDSTYNITGTSYKDDAGLLWGDTVKKDPLSIAQYNALDVANV